MWIKIHRSGYEIFLHSYITGTAPPSIMGFYGIFRCHLHLLEWEKECTLKESMCVLQPKWDTFKDLQILSLWKPMVLLCWNSFEPIPCEFIRFSDVTEGNNWISNRSRKAWKKVLKESWKSWLLQVKNLLYMLLSRNLFGHGWLFFGFPSGSSRFPTAWQSPSLRHCSCNINCWVLTILQNIIIWPKKTGDSKINRYVKDVLFVANMLFSEFLLLFSGIRPGKPPLGLCTQQCRLHGHEDLGCEQCRRERRLYREVVSQRLRYFNNKDADVWTVLPKMDGLWRDDEKRVLPF